MSSEQVKREAFIKLLVDINNACMAGPPQRRHALNASLMTGIDALYQEISRLSLALTEARAKLVEAEKDAEIYAELDRAIAKFPTWPTDPLHAVAVVGEEVGELVKEVLQYTYEPEKTSLAEVRKEAIQAAAMTIRFFRSLDRYRYNRGEQHKQDAALDSARREKP